MADNSRSLKRSKSKLEPISVDELASDSTMTGFSDLFKIPTDSAQQSVNSSANHWKRPVDVLKGMSVLRLAGEKAERAASPLETSGPVSHVASDVHQLTALVRQRESSLPFKGKAEIAVRPDIHSPGVNAVDQLENSTLPAQARSNAAPYTGGSETSPPVMSTPVFATLPRRLQIREARLVQDGHTYGEQTVYDALWKNGTIVSDSLRLITVGFLRMASIAGLAESNCKTAVAGLLDKLAIERLSNQNVSQGHTYRVYSWPAVLTRRRAAGLTHVIKSRGVVFVDPKSGRQLTAAHTHPRRPKTTLLGANGPETDGPVSAPGITETYLDRIPPKPLTAQPPANNQKGYTAHEVAILDLAARFRIDLDPSFNDSAAGRLWRECRTSVPDCTIEEILHFVTLKAQRFIEIARYETRLGFC